jgi:hypothetical protein
LTQKIGKASFFRIVEISVETDKEGIVGGTHVESNHFPALLEVSFQVQEWRGLSSHSAILR